jgi:hypothetical protein
VQRRGFFLEAARRCPTLASLGAIPLLIAILASPAQGRVLGSPLTVAPNVGHGCETKPTFTSESFDGYYRPRPSGQADCTWYQAGVGGSVDYSDPRTGSVPADGVITSVAVRSGPNPAAMRIVILRQIGGVSGGGSTSGCCGFVSETPPAGAPPLQPQPNTVTGFSVNIPVERNVRGTSAVADYVGISAITGTGELPLFSNGRTNVISDYTTGNPVAGFFYPRMGALEGPGGGTRNDESIPGVEVLLQWNWEPTPTLGPPPPPPGAPAVTSLANQVARVKAGNALIRLSCSGNAICEGQLALLGAGAVAAAKKSKPLVLGRQGYRLNANSSQTVKVKLNGRGKALLRKRKKARVRLRISPMGAAPVTSGLTLRR